MEPNALLPEDEQQSHEPASMSVLAIVGFVLALVGLLCPPLGLVAIVLAIIALVKVSGAQGRLGGRGLAIAGLIVGVLSLLLIPIYAALFLPAVTHGREQARRVSSGNNLNIMIKCCHLYSDASSNLGLFPDDPMKLYPDYIRDWRVFDSPRFSGQDVDYIYLPGSSPMSSNIVFYENVPAGRAKEGRNVAIADGSVQWVSDPQFQTMLSSTQQQLRGGAKPVPISISAMRGKSGP